MTDPAKRRLPRARTDRWPTSWPSAAAGQRGGGLEHREALIYTLGKAAELEHLVMLQYLFAAFSLKQNVSEGRLRGARSSRSSVGAGRCSRSASRRCSTWRSSRTS